MPFLSQFAQANAQSGIDAACVSSLQVRQAFDNSNRWVNRHGIICKTKQACERDGRTMNVGRGNIVCINIDILTLPNQDDAWVSAQNGFQLRDRGLSIIGFFLVAPRRTACTVRRSKRPENKSQTERQGANCDD